MAGEASVEGLSGVDRTKAARRRWSAFGAKAPGREIFEIPSNAGANCAEAAEAIDAQLSRWPDDEGCSRRISECEEEDDRLTAGSAARRRAA